MCSGFGDVDFAVTTMKDGAFDYVSKPFKNEEVVEKAKRALASVKTETEKKQAPEAGGLAETLVEKTKKGKKTLLPVIVILLFIGIAVAAVFLFKFGKGEQAQIYSITYNNPTGISFDGEYLWVSDWFGQTVYKHMIGGELDIVKYFSFSELHPAGISWGGNCIWTVDSWTNQINCHEVDDRMSIKETYSYPGAAPSGIFFDGTFLWVCDVEQDKIYKLMPEGNQMVIIEEFRSQGPNPIGIFWDKKNIWTVDGDLKRVYKHNMDPQLTVLETFKFQGEAVRNMKISGVGWDGENIWLSADKKPEIVRVSMKQLKKQ